MKPECYVPERDKLRSRWREVRLRRLELKKIMTGKDYTIAEIRHNTAYKRLKKEQKHLSLMIKHIEYRICKGNQK